MKPPGEQYDNATCPVALLRILSDDPDTDSTECRVVPVGPKCLLASLRPRPTMSRRSSSLRKTLSAVWFIGAVIGAVFLFGNPDERAGAPDVLPVQIDTASAANSASVDTRSSRDDGITYQVTASSLRLRASPSGDAAIRGSARQGEHVEVLGQQGQWFGVRLRDGSNGWMYSDHLTPVESKPSRNGEQLPAVPVNRSAFTDVVGRATITDGDTIRIGDIRIRLQGIDAPESGQSCEDAAGRLYPCGGRAANKLDALVGRQTVACRRDDTDRYGRVVGTCEMLTTGDSLNAYMVRTGWALAYRQYATAYVADEAAAQEAKNGLWQGRFVPPWDYRAGTRLERSGNGLAGAESRSAEQAEATTSKPGPCAIKGNTSDSGRIYHVPGSKWYARTRIDTGRGERWFCSESEAQAAGWRAPRR